MKWGVSPRSESPQCAMNRSTATSERQRAPCELPGLAQRPFAGRALRSKAGATGWKPRSGKDPPWRLLCDVRGGFVLS
jgi:hypothetical protein